MIINWILDSSETEPSIQNCSAIFFIALAEARILMQLSQYLVKSWDRMVALKVLEFLLDGPAGLLFVLAFL